MSRRHPTCTGDAQLADQQLLANPDFEGGMDGWLLEGTAMIGEPAALGVSFQTRRATTSSPSSCSTPRGGSDVTAFWFDDLELVASAE